MLSSKQRQHLKSLAHPLKPIVMIGQKGLSDGVVKETDRALHDHELIKVRLGDLAAAGQSEDDARASVADLLASQTKSEVVGIIGKLGILYRAREDDPAIKLPRDG